MPRSNAIHTFAIAAFALVAAAGLSAQAAPAAPAAAAPSRPDALLLYRQGRDLETANKQADAQAKYQQSVSICDAELAQDPRRIEAYVVKCWSLFRLSKHQDVINAGSTAMKIQFDPRVAEIMGESYFYLGQNDLALKSFQRFVDAADPSADRLPTAYFYMGEIYSRLKKFSHADIAYSMAVSKEGNMGRWWFRLGLACENLGEWKRASDAYAKALALSPDMQEAKDGQARVKGKAGN